MKHKKIQVCVIASRKNKYYLLRLLTNKRTGGFWQNITGSVEGKESYKAAAIRELFEETGIDQTQHLKKLDFEIEFFDKWKRSVIEKAYLAQISDTIEIQLSAEHDKFEWLEINKVNEEHFKFPSNFEVFKKACDKLIS